MEQGGFSYAAVGEFLRFFGHALKSQYQTTETRNQVSGRLLQDLGSYINQHPELSDDLKEEIRMLGRLQGALLIAPEMPIPERQSLDH